MNEGEKEGDTMNRTKSNVVTIFFVLFSIFFGLRVMLAQQKPISSVKTQNLAAKRQPAVGKWTATKLPVPSTAKTYTIGQLLKLINTNNPGNTSTFITPINGSQIVGDAQCWSVGVGPGGKKIINNITGSRSVANAGLTALINTNLNATVQLRADPVLLDHLYNTGRFPDVKAKALYGRILVYFVKEGYRFYIADPFPAPIVRMARGGVNPAQNILDKWNFNQTF